MCLLCFHESLHSRGYGKSEKVLFCFFWVLHMDYMRAASVEYLEENNPYGLVNKVLFDSII